MSILGAIGAGLVSKAAGALFDKTGIAKSNRSDSYQDQHNAYLQREREGIVARVEGAKAAGIHPLVAMGFQGQSGPGQVVGSDPIQPYETAPQPKETPPPIRDPADPNIARYNKARADLAELDVIAAQKRLSDGNLASQPGQGKPVILPTDSANLVRGRLKPGVKVVPDEVTAGTSGLTAGVHPGGSVVTIPTGKDGSGTPYRITVPSNKVSEGLEDLEMAKYIAMMAMNGWRIGEFFKSDIPWAARGYLDDARKWYKRSLERDRLPNRR